MVCLVRRLIVTLASLIGAGFLVSLLAVRLTRLTGWWPVEALDTLALHVALALLIGIGVLALGLRSRTLAVLFAMVLVFCAQQFGPQLMRSTGRPGAAIVTADESRPRLRILTLNLHAPNDDPTPYLALVRETRPDVVVFQEVTPVFAHRFDAAAQGEYPFQVTAGLAANHEGSGTWSRLPLVDGERLWPGPLGNAMHRAKLVTGQGEIWLYNVHLANPTGPGREDDKLAMLRRFDGSRRDFELDWLVDETAGLGGPYILAGDFNSAAGSYPYRHFPSSWQDAFAIAGQGFGHTYPSPAHEDPSSWLAVLMPMLRIDYILTSHELWPVATWTRPLPESDHLAVVAELELPSGR